MVSKTIKNQQIKRFKFWLNQNLQDGMHYQHALFQRIRTLDYKHRHHIYQQASELAKHGDDVLVTYEDRACHLWLNLQKIVVRP